MEKPAPTIRTIYGDCPLDLLSDLMTFGGLRAKKDAENNIHWSIISEPTEGWRKRADKWQKEKMWLPLRYYNMDYALALHDGDLMKALEYVKTSLFRNGLPVNLAEEMNLKEPRYDKNKPIHTYGTIFKNLQKTA